MDDEYELMPHEEIAKLREEIRNLKSGRGSATSTSLSSIDALNRNIEQLLLVFREASKEIKSEDSKVLGKLNELLDQNEKIANALLAVADMIKEQKELQQKPVQQPMFQQTRQPMPPPMQQPMPPPMRQSMPPMQPSFNFEDNSLPPLPPFPSMPPMQQKQFPQQRQQNIGEMPPPPPGPLPPLPPKKHGLFRR